MIFKDTRQRLAELYEVELADRAVTVLRFQIAVIEAWREQALLNRRTFPECVARVPVSLGGLGVRLCSPKVAFAFATVGNRSQPSATVCVSAVRLSTRVRLEWSWKRVKLSSGAAVTLVFAEEVSVWVICVAAVILVSAEEVSERVICVAALYWRLQRRCQCEWSVSPQLYWCLQRRCQCERSVSPQFYWCLQRRCLWEWSVSPQFYRRLQSRCLCDISVSPQLYWCLPRRCLCEWPVAPQFY